jgi:hypothetical protein
MGHWARPAPLKSRRSSKYSSRAAHGKVSLEYIGRGFALECYQVHYPQMIDSLIIGSDGMDVHPTPGTLVEGAAKAQWKRERKSVQFY